MNQSFSCEQIEHDEVVERYAAGTLPEDAAEAFEEHYFRCAACLASLEAVQEATVVLRKPVTVRRFSYIGLALAASLVVTLAGALVWNLAPVTERPAPVSVARDEPPAQNPWVELGKFEAPAFRESTLRGATDTPGNEFSDGIRAYQQGNYTRAAAFLQIAAETNPRDARTQFFLGISQILAGNPAGGLEALRRVDAMGLTPFQEEARFYQAKALLQQGDAAGARSLLTTLVAMRGDWETQAKELLGKLTK